MHEEKARKWTFGPPLFRKRNCAKSPDSRSRRLILRLRSCGKSRSSQTGLSNAFSFSLRLCHEAVLPLSGVGVRPTERWRKARYGPATTIYNRYNRWSQRGLWQRLFEQIAASGDVPRELSLDSSHVKAHRSAAGAKGGSGRKRSGARAAVAPRKSIVWPMIAAGRSPSR